MKRKKSPGLFTGYWFDPITRKRIKPIRRHEYGELYRLERLGRQSWDFNMHTGPRESRPGLWYNSHVWWLPKRSV